MKKLVAVVTGASSGIGYEIAIMLHDLGYKVYALNRSHGKLEHSERDIKWIHTDISNQESIEEGFSKIILAEKNIDVLVCNAGFGIAGAVEEISIEKCREQFEVNFFGTVQCISQVLPIMRESKAGRIVIISSAAGIFPIPYQVFYSSSKEALLSYTRGVSMELKSFGIKVSALCPGDTKTAFNQSRCIVMSEGDSVYATKLEQSLQRMINDENNGNAPQDVALEVLKIIKRKNPKTVYFSGYKYKFFYILNRILPLRAVDYILTKLYS